jgi:hypothetical protein
LGAAFIFFVLDDYFGRINKIQKGKESIHIKLAYNMKDEK